MAARSRVTEPMTAEERDRYGIPPTLSAGAPPAGAATIGAPHEQTYGPPASGQ